MAQRLIAAACLIDDYRKDAPAGEHETLERIAEELRALAIQHKGADLPSSQLRTVGINIIIDLARAMQYETAQQKAEHLDN